jgi:uncharacterized protein YjlB
MAGRHRGATASIPTSISTPARTKCWGIARGQAHVRFGGASGRRFTLKAGDVVVLPAGTGHRSLGGSRDLLVIGAYSATGWYDEPKPQEVDHAQARAAIARVPLPAQDPVYGREGPLKALWLASIIRPRDRGTQLRRRHAVRRT